MVRKVSECWHEGKATLSTCGFFDCAHVWESCGKVGYAQKGVYRM